MFVNWKIEVIEILMSYKKEFDYSLQSTSYQKMRTFVCELKKCRNEIPMSYKKEFDMGSTTLLTNLCFIHLYIPTTYYCLIWLVLKSLIWLVLKRCLAVWPGIHLLAQCFCIASSTIHYSLFIVYERYR